jgi:hypothetical protein
VPVTRTLGANLLVVESTSSTGLTTTPAPFDLVTAVGIGSITAAVITAFATSRRERGAWLREFQIAANQEFHASVEALVNFLEGPATCALELPVIGKETELATRIYSLTSDIDDLVSTIGSKYQRLVSLGSQSTVDFANILFRHIDTYARLAVPPPGECNEASVEQRKIALEAIAAVVEHLLYVMRRDMRLVGRHWKLRLEMSKKRKAALRS